VGVNFSSIEIGRRALRANQLGVSVTGQNIANVNTPGYSRQSVQLSAAASESSGNRFIGNGVTIDGVRGFRDRFVESRLQTEKGINGRLTAERDALAPVDVAFSDSETGGIRSSISSFFNSFSALEAQPNSLTARTSVVAQGTEISNAFRSTRSRLSDIRTDADSALRQSVDEANNLAQQVAALNGRIGVAANTGAGTSELQDQRSQLVNQLAELTGARSIENSDGSLTLTLSDGRALVAGDHASKLETASTTPDGLAAITLDGQPVEITDGRIGGLRNAIKFIGEQFTALDDLAASIADRVNTLHASGSDLNGQDGTPFFVSSDGAPISASNLSVAAAIKADPRLVVAASRGAGSGDATIARSLAALLNDNSSQAGTRTGSFNSIFASIVTEAGARVKSADDALNTQGLILAQTEAQRESISGVSLDEEAINLLQYQKAYEAAARFLKIADEMTQTILALGQ